MRRNDREITDRNEMIAVMEKCDVCRLAINDTNGYPYILPLNFGMEVTEDKIILYFHSALEGKKLDLFSRDKRVGFEMDRDHKLQYFKEKGYCTMSYESIIGRGKIRILKDEEKFGALTKLMEHYHPGKEAPFNPAAMTRTTVYCLEVEEMTGKRKLPK
ncbi:MAG: pyridoxamine 5'-phosphate oxidase family protein [Lachnospiraceae bacterium]|nr:pyridoxamine 5'-phosphate oxidase family protein [Lachnospiraceae bacterium]